MDFQVALAQRLDVGAIEPFVFNDDWYFEQKLDGERLAIIVNDGDCRGVNRAGGASRVDVRIVRSLVAAYGTWVIDGEWVDETFWMFDLPISPRHGVEAPFHLRRAALEAIAPTITSEARNVRLLPTHRTAQAKVALVRSVVEHHAEGLILKDANACYACGKRSPGVRKAKLIETVDCVVLEVGREGKRSLAVGLFESDVDETLHNVGSVAVTDEMLRTLQVGNVVEVEYLYATTDVRLYQPVFVKLRTDKQPHECLLDQLKFTDKTVIV